MKRNFEQWFSKFKYSIATYDYYVDFAKICDNVNKIKVELNMLNSLIGSRNIEDNFLIIIKNYPHVLKCIPLLLAIRSKEIYLIDNNGEKLYNFEKMNYTPKQYAIFMREIGLFDLMENNFIHNLFDYATGVETGLDSNARKNRGGDIMENLVEKFIIDAGYVNNVTYFKEMLLSDIEENFR